MEEYAADFSLTIDNSEFSVYLRSGFYKSRGSRWQVLHCHPNYELQIFEKGEFDFFMGNNSHHIEAPAVMLVSPNVNHSFYSDSQDACRVCIEFSMKKKGDGISYLDYSRILQCIGEYKIIRASISNASEFRYKNTDLPDFEQTALRKNAITKIIIEMFGLLRKTDVVSEFVSKDTKDTKRNELLADVLKYVEAHFAEEITLNTVASAHFVSPRQVERILRTELDENFLHLVNRCRIENIAREMLGGNEDYVTLSAENGFSDYTTFWRNFKKYTGQSPSVFLENNKRKKSVK